MTRDRGSYGPPSVHDEHWALDWGASHAVGYVHDHTVGAALRLVLPVVGDVMSAQRGAERLWYASRGIGGRGEAAKPAARIGQELIHTVSDRDRALRQISTGFQALVNDLIVWQAANKDHPEANVTLQWFAADVTPTLEEWAAFVVHQRKSWWIRIATSWEAMENWWERLKQLRSLARVHGITLQSTEPVPLPKTIWQKSETGKGSEATAVLGVLKIVALSAVGFMGAVGLYKSIRSLQARASHVEHQALREIVREELAQQPVKH
jgi:hypothetical protein